MNRSQFTTDLQVRITTAEKWPDLQLLRNDQIYNCSEKWPDLQLLREMTRFTTALRNDQLYNCSEKWPDLQLQQLWEMTRFTTALRNDQIYECSEKWTDRKLLNWAADASEKWNCANWHLRWLVSFDMYPQKCRASGRSATKAMNALKDDLGQKEEKAHKFQSVICLEYA